MIWWYFPLIITLKLVYGFLPHIMSWMDPIFCQTYPYGIQQPWNPVLFLLNTLGVSVKFTPAIILTMYSTSIPFLFPAIKYFSLKSLLVSKPGLEELPEEYILCMTVQQQIWYFELKFASPFRMEETASLYNLWFYWSQHPVPVIE